MIVRGAEPAPWTIVLANTMIKLGLVLLAYGLDRFLGQRSNGWIGCAMLTIYTVIWTVAVIVDPTDLAIRIHSSTILTVIVMSMICRSLLRDRLQPRLLRWAAVAVFAEYMVASCVQSLMEYRRPSEAQNVAVLGDGNAWSAAGAALPDRLLRLSAVYGQFPAVVRSARKERGYVP
jgi:hypothetical protein